MASAEYAFIPRSDFDRIKPKDTLNLDPSAFKIKPELISPTIKIANPDLDVNPRLNIKAEDLRIATFSKKLILDKNLITKVNDLQ